MFLFLTPKVSPNPEKNFKKITVLHVFYVLEGYWKALEIISVVQPIESFVTSKMSRD